MQKQAQFFSTSDGVCVYFQNYETEPCQLREIGCDHKFSLVSLCDGGRGERIRRRKFSRRHDPLQRTDPPNI